MSGFHINNSPEAIAAFMAEQRNPLAAIAEYQRDVLAALGRIEALLTSAFNGGTAVVTEADGPLATMRSEVSALREDINRLDAEAKADEAKLAELNLRTAKTLSRLTRETGDLPAAPPATRPGPPENA